MAGIKTHKYCKFGKEKKLNSVSIIALGDISFGDHFVSLSYGVNSMLKKNPNIEIFKNVKHIFKNKDIVFGNLETVLSEYNLNKKKIAPMVMRGRKEYIHQIVDAGFNVINIANNHALQHGKEAFIETVKLLQKNNIKVVGIAKENGNNCEPCIFKIKNKKVIFLGYAFEKEKFYKGKTLYAQATEKHILQDIKKYKNKDNFVICSFHWGNEFIDYPSYKQKNFARLCIDMGCDLILGHHPHVIQGYELYKDKPVFYSLGNFVFDMLWNKRLIRSLIAGFELNDNVIIKKIYPVKINKNYTPILTTDIYFIEKMKELSKKISKKSIRDDNSYNKDSKQLEREYRYRSYLYLMKNIYKYDFKILIKIITKTILSKLSLISKNIEIYYEILYHD